MERPKPLRTSEQTAEIVAVLRKSGTSCVQVARTHGRYPRAELGRVDVGGALPEPVSQLAYTAPPPNN